MDYLVAGVFVLLFGWFASRSVYLQLRGLQAIGIIVELAREESAGESLVYYPVVQFTTQTGELHRARSVLGMPEASTTFRVGQRVELLYLATKPQQFVIRSYEVSGVLYLFLAAVVMLAILFYEPLLIWLQP